MDSGAEDIVRCVTTFDPLFRRLKQFQPAFEDEDAVKPQIQLHRSPSRHFDDEELTEMPGPTDLFALHGGGEPLSPVGSPEPACDALRAVANLAEAIDPQKLDKKVTQSAVVDFLKVSYRFLSGHEPKRGRSRSYVGGGSSSHFPSSVSAVETSNRNFAWFMLGQIVDSLIVYGNTVPSLLNELMGKSENITMLLKILEHANFLAAGEDNPLRDPKSIRLHRATTEVDELEATLIENEVPTDLAVKLVSAYAQELLVDAALPPAVCSGRYEAANEQAWRQRGVLCSQILLPKSARFTAMLVADGNYQHIATLMALSLSAKYKVRQKLCDKLAADGLFRRFAEDIFPRRTSRRQLIPDNEKITWVLDILCAFSRPSDEEADSAQTPRRSRKRNTIQWVNDRLLNRVLQGCVDILAEIPAPVRGGKMHVFGVKVTAFLVNCVEMDSVPLLGQIIELVNAALDHVFSKCVHRLLPIVTAILRSILIRKENGCEQTTEWRNTVSCWFGSILIHANYSQSRAKSVAREQLLRVEPYFRFAMDLCEDCIWKEGAKNFLEKTLTMAEFLCELSRERNCVNMLHSVAHRTASVLRQAGLVPSPRWVPMSAEKHRPASTPRASSRKRGRSKTPREETPYQPEEVPVTASSLFSPATAEDGSEDMSLPCSVMATAGSSSQSQHQQSSSGSGSGTFSFLSSPTKGSFASFFTGGSATQSATGGGEGSSSSFSGAQYGEDANSSNETFSTGSLFSPTALDETRQQVQSPSTTIRRSRSPQSGRSPVDLSFDDSGTSPVVSTVVPRGVSGIQATWRALKSLTPFASTSRANSKEQQPPNTGDENGW